MWAFFQSWCRARPALLFALLSGVVLAGEIPVSFTPLSPVERFPYVIGTQTIGVQYQFSDRTRLVETAEVIHQAGSNILKITLGPQTFASYALPKDPAITDLVALVTREPSVRHVLAMPFAQVLCWVEPMRGGGGPQRFGDTEREVQYREIYDLVRHLLTTFTGSGRAFYLGHWEGDWLLRLGKPGGGYEDQADPERIKNMIAWLTTRQRAIDDAKRDTPHHDVAVWGYTEVNRVMDDLVPGHRGLSNSVLPQVDVDFVSYSSYDATSGPPERIRERLARAIAHIESRLRPRPAISGRRVFIGEFGTPQSATTSPAEFESLARNVLLAGLEADCPLVLFWEVYCNERDAQGRHKGYWLIDDQGRRTPLYQTFAAFQTEARAFVADHLAKHGKVPDRETYRRSAIAILTALPPGNPSPSTNR